MAKVTRVWPKPDDPMFGGGIVVGTPGAPLYRQRRRAEGRSARPVDDLSEMVRFGDPPELWEAAIPEGWSGPDPREPGPWPPPEDGEQT